MTNIVLLFSAAGFWAAVALLMVWRFTLPEKFVAALRRIECEAFVWARAVEASRRESESARAQWERKTPTVIDITADSLTLRQVSAAMAAAVEAATPEAVWSVKSS